MISEFTLKLVYINNIQKNHLQENHRIFVEHLPRILFIRKVASDGKVQKYDFYEQDLNALELEIFFYRKVFQKPL